MQAASYLLYLMGAFVLPDEAQNASPNLPYWGVFTVTRNTEMETHKPAHAKQATTHSAALVWVKTDSKRK